MANLQIKLSKELNLAAVVGLGVIIDISVLLAFNSFISQAVVLGNIVSTSTALIVTFILVRKLGLGSLINLSGNKVKAFRMVILCGLWLIQPVIMAFLWIILDAQITNSVLLLLTIKSIAAVAVLIWDVLFYLGLKTRN